MTGPASMQMTHEASASLSSKPPGSCKADHQQYLDVEEYFKDPTKGSDETKARAAYIEQEWARLKGKPRKSAVSLLRNATGAGGPQLSFMSSLAIEAKRSDREEPDEEPDTAAQAASGAAATALILEVEREEAVKRASFGGAAISAAACWPSWAKEAASSQPQAPLAALVPGVATASMAIHNRSLRQPGQNLGTSDGALAGHQASLAADSADHSPADHQTGCLSSLDAAEVSLPAMLEPLYQHKIPAILCQSTAAPPDSLPAVLHRLQGALEDARPLLEAVLDDRPFIVRPAEIFNIQACLTSVISRFPQVSQLHLTSPSGHHE